MVHARQLGNKLPDERRGVVGKNAAALASLVPASPPPGDLERHLDVERRSVGRFKLAEDVIALIPPELPLRALLQRHQDVAALGLGERLDLQECLGWEALPQGAIDAA